MFVFTALPFKFWTWQTVNEGLDIKAGSLSLSLLPTTFTLCLSQLCLCDLCFLCFFFFLSSLSRSCSCRLLLDLHSLLLLLLLSLSDSFLSLFLLFFFAFFSWRIGVKNKEVAQKSSFNTSKPKHWSMFLLNQHKNHFSRQQTPNMVTTACHAERRVGVVASDEREKERISKGKVERKRKRELRRALKVTLSPSFSSFCLNLDVVRL